MNECNFLSKWINVCILFTFLFASVRWWGKNTWYWQWHEAKYLTHSWMTNTWASTNTLTPLTICEPESTLLTYRPYMNLYEYSLNTDMWASTKTADSPINGLISTSIWFDKQSIATCSTGCHWKKAYWHSHAHTWWKKPFHFKETIIYTCIQLTLWPN